MGPCGLQGWVFLESDKSQSETHPQCLVPGKSGLREESGALVSGLSPKEEFPEVWPGLRPGFVALGMADG